MPFLGTQPAESALETGHLNDDIVTEAKMANDAIGLAELKAGTDGELITWDASGNPTTVGAGTSGHFLKSQGAGSVPVFAEAGGGAWTLVNMTNVTSATSAVTVTGLDNSTYNTYCITIANLVPEDDNRGLRLRLGDSGGLKTGSSDYAWASSNVDGPGNEANISANSNHSYIEIVDTTDWVGSGTGEGYSAVIYLHISTSSGPVDPMLHGTYCAKDQSRVHHAGWLSGSTVGMYTITQFSIYASSGNIDNGRVTTYGIKHT